MFASELKTVRRLGVRGHKWGICLQSVLNLLVMLSSGLMMWKALALATNSESPVVVVLSGSMEPAFYRGDILFLTNPATERFAVGDITVYKIPGADIPIVHRVIEAHDLPLSASALPDQLLLTKGDNNPGDDIDLYRGEKWLRRSNVVGKVRGFLPYVGYATIVNDFPQLKYALLGTVGLAAVFSGES